MKLIVLAVVVVVMGLFLGNGLQTIHDAFTPVQQQTAQAAQTQTAFKTVDLGTRTGVFTYLPGQNQMVVAAGYTDSSGTCSVRHWWSSDQPVEIAGGQYQVVLVLEIMPDQMGPVLAQYQQEAQSRLHTTCEYR